MIRIALEFNIKAFFAENKNDQVFDKEKKTKKKTPQKQPWLFLL